MRLKTSLFVLLVLGIGVSCQQKSGPVLVEVGNEVITEPDLELLIKVNPRLQRRMSTAAGKKQILDNYVEQALMFQEAKKQGLGRNPLVKAKLDLYKKVILAQALLETQLEDATQKYYDENKGEFEKIKIAHIYVPFVTKEPNRALTKDKKVKQTEAQAKKLIGTIQESLKKDPTQFEVLVEKYSKDARTNKRKGDLGWVTLSDARIRRWGWAPVVEKSFPLAAKDISEPIKSVNGFHIVRVEEPKRVDEFDTVKQRVRFKIQSQVKSALVKDLKDKYDVSFAEESSEAAVPSPSGAEPKKAPVPPSAPQG